MRMIVLLTLVAISLLGCSKDYRTVAKVDIPRYMGDWYVIAILPNFIEKHAVNGIESYRLQEDGRIGVTYTYYKNSPTGKRKVMYPTGKVHNTVTNAEWRMQLFKPFWAKYLIIYLDDDYQHTAVGVPNRKYVWIMSRSPQMPEDEYQRILRELAAQGYNTKRIVKMPQIW